MLTDQDRSAEVVPRKVKVRTLSTKSPLMVRGDGSALCFLKSRMIASVFAVFRASLFAAHHKDSCMISSL